VYVNRTVLSKNSITARMVNIDQGIQMPDFRWGGGKYSRRGLGVGAGRMIGAGAAGPYIVEKRGGGASFFMLRS
jgi:hypothetical protein